MSKLIGDLLQTDQRKFADLILRLESMCLQPGVDTKLTAEIIVGSREKANKLGLDPKDTTKEELYYGLLAKAKSGDLVLRDRLKITDKTSVSKTAQIIAEHCEKLLSKDLVVCMQTTAIKKLLKAVPPKKTMRLLKFRSVDSVLKREDPRLLYALAVRLEDKSWHTQISARMKRLQPRDARESHVQILSLPTAWLEKLENVMFDSVLQPVPETGSILILPIMPVSIPGSILLTICLVLQAGQKLAIQSLPFRTRSLTTSYEKLLPEIASGLLNEMQPIHGLTPSWDAVFQLIADRGRDINSDFEFILGDLEWQSIETRLSSLASEMDYWVNTHYLGTTTNHAPISFHIVDVTASLVLGKKFGSQITSHLRASLWNELQLRYLKQENLEKSVISQLTLAQEVML